MKPRGPSSAAGRLTLIGLLVAVAGVMMQMLSGVPYPPVPPVFFILLVPAALIAFGPWRWKTLVAVLGGLFLIFGLFASRAVVRLFDASQHGGLGGSLGLWVQMLGVVLATVAGLIATWQSYRRAPATARAAERA
jgi:hypothetical protein